MHGLETSVYGSSLKSAEICLRHINVSKYDWYKSGQNPPVRKIHETDMVNDMPGVHKMFMVRMSVRTDELANVRFYTRNGAETHRPQGKVVQVRFIKNFYYEKPCIVTGNTKLAGPEQEPKNIYVWIELSERGKLFYIFI